MAPELGSLLLDILAERRRECLAGCWPEVPEWVFPSITGGLWDQDNFERSWRRVRRRAQKEGVRPLWLHCTALDAVDLEQNENAPALTDRGVSEILARPARLERATFRSANRSKPKK